MRLAWPIRLGRRLEWSAGGDHPLEFDLRQPRWPPFFATAFFLPRMTAWIKNRGAELPDTSFGLYVRQYDGPAGEIPSLKKGWVDTAHRELKGPWPPSESRRVAFRVRARNLPHEGTYVLMILGTKFLPLGTPREELMRVIDDGDTPKETRAALIRSSEEVSVGTLFTALTGLVVATFG